MEPTKRDIPEIGSKAFIQYVDEDVSHMFRKDKAMGRVNANLQKDDLAVGRAQYAIGEVNAPKIEYINEDLSEFYRPKAPRAKAIANALHEGERSIPVGSDPHHSDGPASEGYSAIEYLDEDLSDVYRTQPKPSMQAMVNYWGFSKKHSSAKEKDQKPSETAENATPHLTRESRWEVDPSKNRMLSTLKWLDGYGVNVESVHPPGQPSVDDGVEAEDEDDSDDSVGSFEVELEEVKPEQAKPVEKEDLASTLSWLTQHGFTKKKNGQIKMLSALSN